MNTTPHTHVIKIPAGKYHTQVIEFDSEYAERTITIRAGVASHVAIVCTGIDIAGSLHIDIVAEHPDVRIHVGVACTVRGTDRCVITTLQQHKAENSVSNLYVRKIVSDEAYAQYRGMIHIEKQAIRSRVSQNDKTLFDGVHARAESIPAIEVLTDDVMCTHGSAMGRIDTDVLWYMHIRGIESQEATEMWYAAFLDEVWHAVFKEGSEV